MSRYNRPMSTYRKGQIWTLRQMRGGWEVVEATQTTPFNACYADKAHAQRAVDSANARVHVGPSVDEANARVTASAMRKRVY
jgi:hypothetical protein